MPTIWQPGYKIETPGEMEAPSLELCLHDCLDKRVQNCKVGGMCIARWLWVTCVLCRGWWKLWVRKKWKMENNREKNTDQFVIQSLKISIGFMWISHQSTLRQLLDRRKARKKIMSTEPLRFINLKVLISFSFKRNGEVLSR